MTYLKVDAWGPGNFLTEAPIVADINFFLVERTWTSLANNIRSRAR